MTEPVTSKKSLALIENFRSPDGIRAQVFKSNLGGDAIVIIEADTVGGDEAEVTLGCHEVAALHDWLGRALGLSAAPPSPQSTIVSLTSKDRSIALAARLRTIAGVYDTPNAKTLREAANMLDLTRPCSDEIPMPQSPVAFPRAWGCDAANGWTIDPALLIAIHDEISGEEFGTSQEGVELVLLAYERISNAAKASQSITINGFQARMLMKFADAEDDCYMEVARLPARKSTDGEDMEAGLYVWMTEYPQEGCLLLTEEPTEQGFCSESAKAPAGEALARSAGFESVRDLLDGYKALVCERAKAPSAEPRELSASEAQSFDRAFASSPRRLAAEATTITGRDRIEQNVREIQQICDACNFDPTEWLNDETAIGEETAKRCQHDFLKSGCTVRIDSDHRGGRCMVCLESWRLSADGLSVITELCAEQEETPRGPTSVYRDHLHNRVSSMDGCDCTACDMRRRAQKSPIAHYDSPDDETTSRKRMSIYAAPGTKVVFAYPNNGYDGDRKHAAQYLKVGETYTVERTDVGQSCSSVYLREIPGTCFNTVQFSPDDETDHAGRDAE